MTSYQQEGDEEMADSRIWGSGLSKSMHLSPDGKLRPCTSPERCPYKTVSLELATRKDEKADRRVLDIACRQFHENLKALPEDHVAIQDLKRRKLPVTDPVFGWIPDTETALRQFHDAGLTDIDILSSGLADTKRDGTGLQLFAENRLTIAVMALDGHGVTPVAYYARSYKHDPEMDKGFSSGLKYVSSRPASYKVPDRDENGFYTEPYSSDLFLADRALATAQREKALYVVEGQFDAMSCWYGGVKNTVAAAGATDFYQDQLDRCKQLCGADGKIILCLDNDAAGLNGMTKVANRFPDENIYALMIPDGKDPCDYRIEHGDEALQRQMKGYEDIQLMLARNLRASEWPQQLANIQDMKKRIRIAKQMERMAQSNGDDNVTVKTLLDKAGRLKPAGRTLKSHRYRERRRWVRALGVDVQTLPQPAALFSEKIQRSEALRLLAGLKLAAEREGRDLDADRPSKMPKSLYAPENAETIGRFAEQGSYDELLAKAMATVWKGLRRKSK